MPIAEAAKFLDRLHYPRRAWAIDHLASSRSSTIWKSVTKRDLHDGLVIIIPSEAGGYNPTEGWVGLASKLAVEPVEVPTGVGFRSDQTTEGDPLSNTTTAVTLAQHLDDVKVAVTDLIVALNLNPASDFATAMVQAGLFHDLGKASPIFQEAVRGANDQLSPGRIWAKSGSNGRFSYSQPYFRHELASLLALTGDASWLVDGHPLPDLIRYLVAAHHGRVRLSIRRLPDEHTPDGQEVALGVVHKSELPAVTLDDGTLVDHQVLDLVTAVSGDFTRLSYQERALMLRDHPEIGPFRLAMIEAIVRLADWQVSAGYDHRPDDTPRTPRTWPFHTGAIAAPFTA